MRWTEEQWAEYQQKRFSSQSPHDIADEGPESTLQSKIVKFADDHGYPCLSFRQSKKAKGFLVPGWPDITMTLPKGRVLFLELKAKDGGLSDDQKKIKIMMMALGHEWHEVRSYKRFLEIITGGK